jgi:hypothetical protein
MAAWKWQREGIIMTELAHIVPRTFGQPQDQRRTKLQEALSGIPPAKHQQEFAAALAIDKERRFELKSKLDELATDEPSTSVTKLSRGGRVNRRGDDGRAEMKKQEIRREVTREWMALPREKRQTRERTADFAAEAVQKHQLPRSRREPQQVMLDRLLPRTAKT